MRLIDTRTDNEIRRDLEFMFGDWGTAVIATTPDKFNALYYEAKRLSRSGEAMRAEGFYQDQQESVVVARQLTLLDALGLARDHEQDSILWGGRLYHVDSVIGPSQLMTFLAERAGVFSSNKDRTRLRIGADLWDVIGV